MRVLVATDAWRPQVNGVVRTYERLSVEVSRLCKAHGVSPFQYNVLRILRGAGPEGLPSLSIADRMVNRVPDITRLIDRLETMGYVRRTRSNEDRRVVRVCLTREGLRLLETMDEPLVGLHHGQLGHMSRQQLETLHELLDLARQGE